LKLEAGRGYPDIDELAPTQLFIITLSEIIEIRVPYEKLFLRYLISVITEKGVACL
jgi:hypothetical protein